MQSSTESTVKSNRPSCFDLRPWAKEHRYRWRWEESRQPGEDDAFFVEVLCKNGLIYAFGGETLLAYANRGVKQHIAALGDDIRHHQYDGGNEVFKFPVERLDEVAAILKPRRKRAIGASPEQLKAMRERRKSLVQVGQTAQLGGLNARNGQRQGLA